MNKISLFTIGFTKKTAKYFFATLKKNNIKLLIDIRLNNVSQLAGFTKRDDLIFFLSELCNCDYKHMPMLAPTKKILDNYKKKKIDWVVYVQQFTELINHRAIENLFTPDELNNSCLLCSEPTAENCHRRLVAEHLKKRFPNIEIKHLL